MQLSEKIHKNSCVWHNPPYRLKSFGEFPVLGKFYWKLKKNLDFLRPVLPEQGQLDIYSHLLGPKAFLRQLSYSSLSPENRKSLPDFFKFRFPSSSINLEPYFGAGLPVSNKLEFSSYEDYQNFTEGEIEKKRGELESLELSEYCNFIEEVMEKNSIFDLSGLGEGVAIRPNPLFSGVPRLSPLSPAELFAKILTYTDDKMIVCDEGGTSWKPWEEEPNLFLRFAELDLSNDKAIMEFIDKYGPLGFVELGFDCISTWHIDQQGKTKNELWFEPIENFKAHVKLAQRLVRWQRRLQEVGEDLQKCGYRFTNTDKKKHRLTRTQDGLLKKITHSINPRIEGVSFILPGEKNSFIHGWLVNSLHHAIYITLYESLLSGKIAICPGCGREFIKIGKRKYCGELENKDGSSACGSAHRMREYREKLKLTTQKTQEKDPSAPDSEPHSEPPAGEIKKARKSNSKSGKITTQKDPKKGRIVDKGRNEHE